jgi:Zn-dependent peptidase ImmA (M78 family)
MATSKELSGVRADRKYSYRALEQFAAHVREVLKYDPDDAIDALRLFEDLHQIKIKLSDQRVIPFRSGVISLEDSEGYTRYDRSAQIIEVLASESTYHRLEQGHPRSAYFVGHELGHCVLHTEQLVRLAQMPTNQQTAFHRGRADHKPYEDTEWQANAFSSALLMPARGLARLEAGGNLTTEEIGRRFRVSAEAAGYRLTIYQGRKNDLIS